MSEELLIGIDIGGTKTAVCLGGMDGEILEKESFPTAGTWQAVLDRCVTIIKGLLRSRPSAGFQAVGISCGGPLNSAEGIILSPPNLPGWRDVPVCELIREQTGLPAFLENDANACALAEWRWGAGRGYRNMVFLTFGTGLGAGLILNGELYSGSSGLAGEVGHIRMSVDGPSGYGKVGSWEAYCSGGGMSAHYNRLYGDNLSAEEICGQARQGLPRAQYLIRITAEYLGRGIALLIDILNPEKVIIGSIFARQEGLFRGIMEELVAGEALSAAAAVCSVEPSGLGDSIGDMAALGVAMNGVRRKDRIT